MPVREILLLGDERLYRPSTSTAGVARDELRALATDLHDTMADFQARHGWGRAIAAPQIGVPLRMVAMNDASLALGPLTFLDPVVDQRSEDTLEFWEDCMSFPELLVRLRNPRACRLSYVDLEGAHREVELEGDYAELIQHEVDHLDGVLAVQRALDDRSIVLRRSRPPKPRELRGTFRLRPTTPHSLP